MFSRQHKIIISLFCCLRSLWALPHCPQWRRRALHTQRKRFRFPSKDSQLFHIRSLLFGSGNLSGSWAESNRDHESELWAAQPTIQM